MSKFRDVGRNNEDQDEKCSREKSEYRAKLLSTLEGIDDDFALMVIYTEITYTYDIDLIKNAHEAVKSRLVSVLTRLRDNSAWAEYLTARGDLMKYINACK